MMRGIPMKHLAVRISVDVKDEIRIWEVPDNTTVDKVLEYAEYEIENEFQDVGLSYKIELIPISDVEKERESLPY
jgi:hypothetical protein